MDWDKIFDIIGNLVNAGSLISFVFLAYKFLAPRLMSVINKNFWRKCLKSFQTFSLKHDKTINLFFGTILVVGSYLVFLFGSLMAISEYFSGASLSKVIFIELSIIFEVWLFYWMAPAIPPIQISLRNVIKFKY